MFKHLVCIVATLLFTTFTYGQKKADHSIEDLEKRYEKSKQFEEVLIEAFSDSSFIKVTDYYDSIESLQIGGSYRAIKLTLLAYSRLSDLTTNRDQIDIYSRSSTRIRETGERIYGRSSMSEEYSPSALLNDENVGVYTTVENLPEPKNGFEGFYKNLSKTLKYPSAARQNKVEGKVFVAFVVTKSGSIEGVTIAQGIGSGCDQAARQVIMNSPDWIPGSLKSGEKVNVRMILPITFALRKKKNKKSE